MSNINLSFDLSPQALALQTSLAHRVHTDVIGLNGSIAERKHLLIDTAPLYNGRERGICLTVRASSAAGPSLLIFFAEGRGSDNLIVRSCLSNRIFMNPPTIADLTGESYHNEKSFDEWDIRGAGDCILYLIHDFWTEQNQ